MNVVRKNRLLYMLLCAFTGAAIGFVVWVFLRLMNLGIDLLWHTIPGKLNFPLYTIILCLIGGLIIGLFKLKFGDFPESLDTVMGKVKTDGFYPYNNILPMCIAAFLPLIFGGSIGPEAGLTGVIVGLCYWAKDKMQRAYNIAVDFSDAGISATIGVIFGTPLFGLAIPIDQGMDKDEETVLPRPYKIISNVIAVMAAFGIMLLLGKIFGGSAGLPRIDAPDITATERIWGIPLAIICCLFGYLYLFFEHLSAHVFHKLRRRTSIVVTALLGGLILGIIGTFLPLTMFSGEHQIHELTASYQEFAPWLLILIGILKMFVTTTCIESGWMGGHFFPVIFCGISIGYGMALLTGLNIAFCLAVTSAAILGVVMRKPIAVSLLLMLCFPVRVIPWLIIAAFVGSIVPLGKLGQHK